MSYGSITVFTSYYSMADLTDDDMGALALSCYFTYPNGAVENLRLTDCERLFIL